MSRNALPSALAGDTFVAASPGGASMIRNLHWRPGLAPSRHSEIFAATDEAGGTGVALTLALDGLRAQGFSAEDRRAVFWVQDRTSIRLTGRPYRPGLPEELRARMIHIAAKSPEDVLFALEEGLRCRDLACVIGELAGNPKALGLTASRRLSLAAERHGVPLFLVRHDARRDLSSARMRWEVRSAPSPHPRWDPAAPGAPAWRGMLFRARAHTEGQWILHDDGHRLVAEREIATTTPDHGDLARAAGDRSLAAF